MSERAYRVYQRYLKNMEQVSIAGFASRLTYCCLAAFTFSPSQKSCCKTFRSWKNEESQKLRVLDYDQIG